MILEKEKLNVKGLLRVGVILFVIIALFVYRGYLKDNNTKNADTTIDGVVLKELSTNDSLVEKLYNRVRVTNLTLHPNDYYKKDEITNESLTNAIVSYIFLNNYDWDIKDIDELNCDGEKSITTVNTEEINTNLEMLFGNSENIQNNIYIGYHNRYKKLFNLMYSADSNNYVLTCQNSTGESQKLSTNLQKALINNDGSEIKIIEQFEIVSQTDKKENSKGNITFHFKQGKKNEYYLYRVNRSLD